MLSPQNNTQIWPLIIFVFFFSLDKCKLSHLPFSTTTISCVADLAGVTLPDQGTSAQQSKCQALQVAQHTQTHVPVLLHR